MLVMGCCVKECSPREFSANVLSVLHILKRAEVVAHLREEEAVEERPSPVLEYVELLEQHGESAWSTHLIGMGLSMEVPRVFRSTSKARRVKWSGVNLAFCSVQSYSGTSIPS